MPLYRYEPQAEGCDHCSAGFEVLQSMDEQPLERCPQCGQPCRRVITSFAALRSSRDLLSPKNLERHGFTEYRKNSDGFYEKSVGPGPDLHRPK